MAKKSKTQECTRKTRVSKVKVTEFGRSAVIVNADREVFFTTDYDGCVVRNQLAADKLIQKDCLDVIVIVELKGKDVAHALKQVGATARNMSNFGFVAEKVGALVVCTERPRSTHMQKLLRDFARDYRIRLIVETKNREYEFRELYV